MLNRSGRFGGFGLDRMLLDFEAVPDVAAEAPTDPAPDPAGAGDAPELPAVEPAVEPAAETFTLEQVAQIVDSRLHQFQQAQPQAPQPQGDPIDPNEFLNPLDDNFGQNFLQFNQQRDEWMLGEFERQLDQRLGPVQQHFAQEQQTQGQEALTTAFEAAGVSSEKGISIGADLARNYYADLARQYGEGPIAADAAVRKAAAAVKDLIGEAAAGGGQQERQQLAALTNAPNEPSGAGTGLRVIPQGGDELAVARRWAAGIQR